MARTDARRLFRRVTARGLRPAHVAEVGVGPPELSVAWPWVERGIRVTLMEPDPEAARLLREALTSRPKVRLVEVAVAEREGPVVMYHRGTTSFLATVGASPAVSEGGYQPDPGDRIEVRGVPFEHLDDGTIDVLAVDVEGAEWLVIRALRSRPAVISVETHGVRYVNPHAGKLFDWMARHGYRPWYRTFSDTVFVLPDRIRISWLDRLRDTVMGTRIRVRAVRKRLLAREAPSP
jgi:FkbM family methyltransferase